MRKQRKHEYSNQLCVYMLMMLLLPSTQFLWLNDSNEIFGLAMSIDFDSENNVFDC